MQTDIHACALSPVEGLIAKQKKLHHTFTYLSCDIYWDSHILSINFICILTVLLLGNRVADGNQCVLKWDSFSHQSTHQMWQELSIGLNVDCTQRRSDELNLTLLN